MAELRKLPQIAPGALATIGIPAVSSWELMIRTGSLPPSFLGLSELAGPICDMSADGVVVVGNGRPEFGEAIFLYTARQGMRRLRDSWAGGGEGPPDGWAILTAEAVAPDGDVIVGTGASQQGHLEAFRWTRTTGVRGLGVLPSHESSSAVGVSAQGVAIVGTSMSSGSNASLGRDRRLNPPLREAFRWTDDGGMRGLGVLPGRMSSGAEAVSADGKVVVGWSHDEQGRPEAFRWTQDEGLRNLGFIAGGQTSIASSVSADGKVVVGWGGRGEGHPPEAFRWTEAEGIRGLGPLPGFEIGGVDDLSADGKVVVGWSYRGPREKQAVVWTDRDGPHLLSDLLIELKLGEELTGWRLSEARAVSGDGRTIAGLGIDPNGVEGGFIAHLGA